jgi:hypothetical protein
VRGTSWALERKRNRSELGDGAILPAACTQDVLHSRFRGVSAADRVGRGDPIEDDGDVVVLGLIGLVAAKVQMDQSNNREHAGREKAPRTAAIRHFATSAPEQCCDAGPEGYRGKDGKQHHPSPNRATAVVHAVFAHVPFVAGLGHVPFPDSPPGGLAGQSLSHQPTASEHEQSAKYDSGRPARAVVKIRDVDDPGGDQGNAAEEAHSAKQPSQQRTSRPHRCRSDSRRVRSCQSDYRRTETSPEERDGHLDSDGFFPIPSPRDLSPAVCVPARISPSEGPWLTG